MARFQDPPPLEHMESFRRRVAECMGYDFINAVVGKTLPGPSCGLALHVSSWLPRGPNNCCCCSLHGSFGWLHALCFAKK
jgi:hypothetical protein